MNGAKIQRQSSVGSDKATLSDDDSCVLGDFPRALKSCSWDSEDSPPQNLARGPSKVLDPTSSMGAMFGSSLSRKSKGKKDKGARQTQSVVKEEHHDAELAKATFVDVGAMKEKVREKLSKPKYNVCDFYHETGFAQCIARSPIFDKLTLSVIAFNALWIAIDTDMNDASLLLQADTVFICAENGFCLFFAFEWSMRWLAFRRKRDGLKDAWFVFDSFMVSMMVLETWLFTLLILVFLPDAAGGGAGNAGILRMARLLRLSRMARMGKLLRVMPELLIMIKGMKAATRSVFFTLVLLVVIMYVFAIAFVQLSQGTEVGDRYFSGVPESMYTLLIFGIFLDNVGVLTGSLGLSNMNETVLSVMFFIFVLLGSMTVMNMLVGVLCEVVSAVAATEQEEMLVNYVNEKISRVMLLLDSDGGGSISKKEFLEILDNGEAVRCLSDVGVDVFALIDLADYIFESDHSEETEEIELDFARFMEVVLQLRGTNQATVKDIVDLRKFMRLSIQENYKLSTVILQKLDEGALMSQALSKKMLSPQTLKAMSDEVDKARSSVFEEPASRSSCCTSQETSQYSETNSNKDDGFWHQASTGEEFDSRPPLMWPPDTPDGQLLSWVPILLPSPLLALEPLRDEALSGPWETLGDGALATKDVQPKIPEDEELLLPQVAPSQGHLPPRGENHMRPVNHPPLAGMDTGFRIPRLQVNHSGAPRAFDDSELSKALQSQFELLCGQLATGLIDAIDLAGKSVERASAKNQHGFSNNRRKGQSIDL